MKLSEFAIKVLKEYSHENQVPVRSTSDLSQMEQWLISRLYNATEIQLESDKKEIKPKEKYKTLYDHPNYPNLGVIIEEENKFQKLINCLCTEEMIDNGTATKVKSKGKEGYLLSYGAGIGFGIWYDDDSEEYEISENEIEIL